jgi:hypothetical protein
MATDGEDGDVVVGAAGSDAVEQLVTDLLEGQIRQLGELPAPSRPFRSDGRRTGRPPHS